MVTEVRPPLQHSTEIFIQVYDMPNACMDLCGRASSSSACPKSVLRSITYGSLHECVGVTVCPAGTRLSINSFPSERLAPSKPGRGGNSQAVAFPFIHLVDLWSPAWKHEPWEHYFHWGQLRGTDTDANHPSDPLAALKCLNDLADAFSALRRVSTTEEQTMPDPFRRNTRRSKGFSPASFDFPSTCMENMQEVGQES